TSIVKLILLFGSIVVLPMFVLHIVGRAVSSFSAGQRCSSWQGYVKCTHRLPPRHTKAPGAYLICSRCFVLIFQSCEQAIWHLATNWSNYSHASMNSLNPASRRSGI